MNRLARTYWTLKALGWDNVPRRVWQLAKGKLGVHQRTLPGGEISATAMQANFVPDYKREEAAAHWQRRIEHFFLSPARLKEIRALLPQVADDALWSEKVTRQSAELHRGKLLFFGHHWADASWPVKFNRDPMHGIDWPTGKHWSTYKQFDPTLDDIKCVWEASRFAWAFALARQHVRDPQTAFPDAAGQNPLPPAELFWQTFEQWDQQNPYGLTPNWVCGQEATFRLFACLFAAGAMLDDPATTPARLARMTEIVWYIARHIEGNINYARGQKNNHAISEAIGMYTIGLLFPEFARASRWREKGKQVLAVELSRQIYDDGSFVQHSTNYHRLMLHDVIWAIATARAANDDLPPAVFDRARRALEWLRQMTDSQTGGVPNYGYNDGALILPLTCCDYTEFRPAVQTLSLVLHGKRAYPAGPWDEEAAWMATKELQVASSELRLASGNAARPAADAQVAGASNSLLATHNSQLTRASTAFSDGGYYTFKGPRSWGMIRCHTYRDRPAHADMLHFDLWYDGVNVLCDGGSFAYYCPQPWQHWFRSTAAHNTVEIDGQDQMIPGPNFLWLRWTKASGGTKSSRDGRVQSFGGIDKSYLRPGTRAIHSRSIRRVDDTFVVCDHLLTSSPRNVTLRWRFGVTPTTAGDSAWKFDVGPRPYILECKLPGGFRSELKSGNVDSGLAGWRSRYYGERSPAPTLLLSGSAEQTEIITIIRPAESQIRVEPVLRKGVLVSPLIASDDPALQASIDEVAPKRPLNS